MGLFTEEKIQVESNNDDVLKQLKAIERAIKTQTQMTALRLDSIKRSVDVQAVALIAISKLLALTAAKKPEASREKEPEDIVKKMLAEIEWIKAFTDDTEE